MSPPSEFLESIDSPEGDPDMELVLKVVAILADARHQKGFTLRDLSHKMGIAFSHLSRAERGLSQPGLVVLLRWCRALDLRFTDVWKQASGEE